MHFYQIVFEGEHFENEFSKKEFQPWVEICDFPKNIKKYSSLTMGYDQTTWPTTNQKVSVERQCPYLSFGTSRFEISPPVRSQWPFENHGPLKAMTINE